MEKLTARARVQVLSIYFTGVATTTSAATLSLNEMQSNGRQNAMTTLTEQNKRKRKTLSSQKSRSTTLTERMMKLEYSGAGSSLTATNSGVSKDINCTSTADKLHHTLRRVDSKLLLNSPNSSSSSASHITDAEALLAQMHPMHGRYHLLQPDLMSSAFPAAASAAAIAAAGLPTAFPFDLYRCLGSLYTPANDRN